MAAINNLGFAIQAADVSVRSILGIQRNFRDVRSERAGRVEEVLRTIEMYEHAIENLTSGGADLVAESDQLLRSHIAKIVGTMKELTALFVDDDLEMQACSESIEAQVRDDTKWLHFQSLKSELEKLEKGLQFLAMSRIVRYCIHAGLINISMTPTMDQICNSTGSIPGHDARLRNGHIPGNACFVPSAGDLGETAAAHRPPLLPYGFVRTSSISTPCNRTSCKARSLKTMAAVDLSWIKIRLAITASLEVFWGLGGFSIKPSLEVRRVVPPDSKGFNISKKFRNGEHSAEEAVAEFLKAFRKGEASLMDVTADGRSLTESIMEITSLEAAKESCRDIVYLLKTIAGHSAVMECLPALFRFCETAFEFGGIDPFDIINELEILYDVADEDVLGFHHIVQDYDDPFGIKWLQKCLRKCPGFANIPRLIQEILLDDCRTLTGTLIASARSMNETFLGRSALHWATCSQSWVHGLLEAGHDVSIVDQFGRSPLIYAAAYGLLGTVLALLEADADPISSYQRRNGREVNFLQYAMYQGHDHIAFGSIDFFRRNSIRRLDIAQTLLDQALRISCGYWNQPRQWIPHEVHYGPDRAVTVQKLLMLGGNPDLFQNDGDNLLHQSCASGTVCASLILGAGSKHLDVGTSTGETPAMRAAYEANAPLLHLYLHKGARLHRRDHHGRNIVHYAVGEFHRDLSSLLPYELLWKYSTLKTLLSYNVDANVGDYCRCACSLNGCTPSTMLMKQLFRGYQPCFRPSGLALSIEWLLLLQEFVSYNAAEKALAEFARFLLFQISGLTHICCRPKVFRMSWWQESPIDQEDISEILEEEEELIVTLEEDLEALRSLFDQLDPAEAWADMLVNFAKEHEDLARSSDSAKTSFRHALLHYRDETSELLHVVYQDDATFSAGFGQRQALVKRCFDRLNAK